MISRRQFIRNTGLGLSATLLESLPALARTTDKRPVLILYDHSVLPRSYNDYLQQQFAGDYKTDLADWGVEDLLQVAEIFKQRRGYQVIGFVGNDSYPLLEQCARDAGSSILCHSRHIADASGSRHVYYTTAASQGISSVLSGHMQTSGNLSVLEHHHGLHACQLDSSFDPAGCSEWWQLASRSLYQLAEGNWQPCASTRVKRDGQTASSDSYSLEMFAFQL